MLFFFLRYAVLAGQLLSSIVRRDAAALVVRSEVVTAKPRNGRNVRIQVDLSVVVSALIAESSVDHRNTAVGTYGHLNSGSVHRIKRAHRPVWRIARRYQTDSASGHCFDVAGRYSFCGCRHGITLSLPLPIGKSRDKGRSEG